MNAFVPMTDQELDLAAARERVRRPEEHASQELRAACATLQSQGDWIDYERGRLLLARLDQEELWVEVGQPVVDAADEETSSPVPSLAREIARDLLQLAIILTVLFGAFLVAYGFGGRS